MPRRAEQPSKKLMGEYLRRGTREQYTSPWTLIADDSSKDFLHELEEIPWRVDVIRSEQADGRFPVESDATVTVTKTKTTVTVTVAAVGADRYYQVRAL